MTGKKSAVRFDGASKRLTLIFRVVLRYYAYRSLVSESFGTKPYAKFLSSLGGESPDLSKSDDVILAACDDLYFRSFGIDLIQSIENIGNQQAVHLHLLEPAGSVVESVQTLRDRLQFVKLSYTIDPCVLAEGLSRRAVYWNAARFLLAPWIMDQGPKRLLIIDIDAVMNRNPWPLFSADDMAHSGSFIFRRKERRVWRKVLASAVLFNGSPGSRHLASAFARCLAAAYERSPTYHIDQAIPYFLCTIAKRAVSKFRSADIPAKLMSYNYEYDAAFWTVKGSDGMASFIAERAKRLQSHEGRASVGDDVTTG